MRANLARSQAAPYRGNYIPGGGPMRIEMAASLSRANQTTNVV